MSNKFFGRSLRLPYYAVAVGRKPGIYPTHVCFLFIQYEFQMFEIIYRKFSE